MFFFRPSSNFCTLRNSRIAYSRKDFGTFHGRRYLSTVHLVLTCDFRPVSPTRIPSEIRLGNSVHPTSMTRQNAPRTDGSFRTYGFWLAVALLFSSPLLR